MNNNRYFQAKKDTDLNLCQQCIMEGGQSPPKYTLIFFQLYDISIKTE